MFVLLVTCFLFVKLCVHLHFYILVYVALTAIMNDHLKKNVGVPFTHIQALPWKKNFFDGSCTIYNVNKKIQLSSCLIDTEVHLSIRIQYLLATCTLPLLHHSINIS